MVSYKYYYNCRAGVGVLTAGKKQEITITFKADEAKV